MASPTIETLCCLNVGDPFSQSLMTDLHSISYNCVSIIAALLGFGGAVYQILPREQISGVGTQGNQLFKTRGRLIIKWLAVADLMASLGILIRAIVWMIEKTLGSTITSTAGNRAFCIFSSGWIHYFYTATYLWTFVYALDVKWVLEEKKVSQQFYHIACWFLPAILCCTGLMILYLPDLDCHDTTNPYYRFLPNYLSTFVPIVVVMIANPILYCIAFSRVEQLLSSSRGRFTHSERRVVHGLRIKFFLINLVFYTCWSPNIINGLTLWLAWGSLPKTFLTTMWYLMAILNPLQAVFNSVVYRSWETSTRIRLPLWLMTLLGRTYESVDFTQTNKSAISQTSSKGGIFSQPQDDGGQKFWQKMFRYGGQTEKTPLLQTGESRFNGEISETDEEIDTTQYYKKYYGK